MRSGQDEAVLRPPLRADASGAAQARTGAWALRAARAALPLALALPVPASAAEAATGTGLRIAYAPKAVHFTSDPDFVDWNHIVAVEWVTRNHLVWGADRSHFGLSLFDNSYGQFSQSLYAGLEWTWRQAFGGEVFLSVSLGLVNGYEEPWADKVPLNKALGVGITIVPAIGWQRDGIGLALSLSGSALMLRASYTFGF